MDTKNIMKFLFVAIWLGVLTYLITLMLEICKPKQNAVSETTSASGTTSSSNTGSAENFENNDNTFDYSIENFEPHNAEDLGDDAAPREEVAEQEVAFEAPLDNSDTLVQNVTQEDEDEIQVEGTDALIAASSDRFYSVDTKGQTNRNASNDLRGDLPIAYNANYTPFNQSAIYGEPLVPAGRL
jgi:hypothetical protein